MDRSKLVLLLVLGLFGWLAYAHYNSHIRQRASQGVIGSSAGWLGGNPDSVAGDSTYVPQDQVAGNPTL